ncbi:hypothetical protein ACJW30_01G329100 [Castanea mollissima]
MILGFSAIGRKYGLLDDSSAIEELEMFCEDDSVCGIVCGRMVVLEVEAMTEASKQRIIEDTSQEKIPRTTKKLQSKINKEIKSKLEIEQQWRTRTSQEISESLS